MEKVKQNLDEIAAIETEAGGIDPTDKSALYDLLVVAYFKAKDTIILLQDTPASPDPVIAMKNEDLIEKYKVTITETQDIADQWKEAAEEAQADFERMTKEVLAVEAQRKQGIDTYNILLDEKQALESTLKQLENILLPKA